MSKKKTKIFVLDTNVILHDHTCIHQFQEHDIVIPIVVIEELDKFKNGYNVVNYNSREFVRILDGLSDNEVFNGGKSLGHGRGKIRIVNGCQISETIKTSFREDIPDHRILAITENLKEQNPDQKVILVTKDFNLRVKARSIGLIAEDYESDQVSNPDLITKGIAELIDCDQSMINTLHESGQLSLTDWTRATTPKSNEKFILKGPERSNSVLVRFNSVVGKFQKVEKRTVYGIKPRNAEQVFSMDLLTDPTIKLVALTGKAGTGKTLLALAAALEQHKSFEQILLARPIVALSNRDLGFLPGDAMEKINPYMQPLFDNLGVIKHVFKTRSPEYQKIEELLKEDKLLITPLAYIRGRSLSNTFFIIDEAQNLTPHEIKTIITRAAEGTKMVFTGDLQQIDSPYLDIKSNGLAYVAERMKDQDIFGHVNLTKGERSFLAELASDLLGHLF